MQRLLLVVQAAAALRTDEECLRADVLSAAQEPACGARVRLRAFGGVSPPRALRGACERNNRDENECVECPITMVRVSASVGIFFLLG